jgi:hypothetical protein
VKCLYGSGSRTKVEIQYKKHNITSCNAAYPEIEVDDSKTIPADRVDRQRGSYYRESCGTPSSAHLTFSFRVRAATIHLGEYVDYHVMA